MSQIPIRRVLINHPFGLGDALFMTPVIRALHRHGAGKIDLLLGSRTRGLFLHHPCVDDIFVIDKDRLRAGPVLQSGGEIVKLLWQLRKKHYQLMIDFSLSRQYAFFACFVLGIPVRNGFDYKNRGLFLTKRLKLDNGFSKKHAAAYYLDLLKLISVPAEPGKLELFLSGRDEQEAGKALSAHGFSHHQPFIVVAPGGGGSWGRDARLKHWPVRFFAELIRKMHSANVIGPSVRTVVLGGQADLPLAEALEALLPAGTVTLCGKISILASASLIKQACLLIANDSGLVHIASAMETPVLALFGPVDPAVYGPYPASENRIAVTNEGPSCRPCYQNLRYNAECSHVACLTELSPDAVFRQAEGSGLFERLKIKAEKA